MPRGYRYVMERAGAPLIREDGVEFQADCGEVVVQVAGCGISCKDLAVLSGELIPRHPLPLVPGHEIVGRVVDAGPEESAWLGRAVVVPATIPCERCSFCRSGRPALCPGLAIPGNSIDGGLASHAVVPTRALCVVPEVEIRSRGEEWLPDLAVVADPVAVSYEAVGQARIRRGDLAIVVGLGNLGGFCAQAAGARGARVVGVEVNESRAEHMMEHGVELVLNPRDEGPDVIRRHIRAFAKDHHLPTVGWRIFECSGTPGGAETAMALIVHGAQVCVLGLSREPARVMLANLATYAATCAGVRGCSPEHYPAALQLVISGSVVVGPFLERHPMDAVNEVISLARSRHYERRAVLIP